MEPLGGADGARYVDLRHVKTIFLGNDGSTRRSLLCSLANCRESDVKSFDDINQLIRKQHLASRSWVERQLWKVSDNRPHISFWNFCGELECCTHFNFFLSAHQTIYIILFNVSDSPDVVVQQLSYWLRAVFDTGGLEHSIRIFLIGCHSDQVSKTRLDSCAHQIDNLLLAMGVFLPNRSKISLKWWSSADPLRWWWWPTPDSDATTGSVVDAIFEASERILKGPGTLHFPRMCERMLEEVKRLAQNCQESKSMPLVKLSALTEAQGLHVLAGSHQSPQRLDAVKICSEIGILIHFKDFDGEDWIGVNLNFCLDVITYFTNNVMTLKSTSLPLNRCILSKQELYQIMTTVFQSAAPTVSWYASSLARGYPESLFGFFVTQTLLFPVDSRHMQLLSGDAYGFMVPMLLKPRPHSWRAIVGHLFSGPSVQHTSVSSWRFGMPIRIKASRFASPSHESLITVSKFLKLMLSKCFDYRHMWDASFLYHVEGTSIFVRLAEDRLGVDIVTIGPYAAPIPAQVSREVQDIALNLEFRDQQAKRICPHCCLSDHYLKTGLNRVFFEQQLDHYMEHGISAFCYFDHEFEASSLEEGDQVILPAAPEPEGPFFPILTSSSIASLRKTVLWLDDKPSSNERIRRSIPGYVGMKRISYGNVLLEFDFSNIEPAQQMDVYCFESVDAIKSFMTRPDNLKFLTYPSSMFRIITNRRLFVGESGLCAFLDDPSTRWAFSYPSTMIFYGGNPEGLECVKDRPKTLMSTASRDCVAFISFGHMFTSPHV